MSKTPFTKKIAQKLKPSDKSDSKRKSASKKSSTEELREYGFEVGSVLGEGSYCKVRSATYGGEEIAVKVINRSGLSKDFLHKFLPREIEVLSKIKHENIIKIYKIFNYTEKVYIFMEQAKDDMLNYVRDNGRLEEDEARYFFKQIVSAIRYLHGMNIAHRDLKCENIMISEEKEIKIIDLGFCRTTVDSKGRRSLSETYCGSTAYAAPEVLQGIPYNPMMYDVWSLGCVLFIMVTGRMPFDDRNVRKMVSYQMRKKIRFPSSFTVSSTVKDLIRSMLEPDVTRRLTMDRVSKSAWMKLEDSDETKDDVDSDDDSDSSSKHASASSGSSKRQRPESKKSHYKIAERKKSTKRDKSH